MLSDLAPLSKPNCKPAPVGAVTVIVPVATAQVGCTVVAVGAAGVAGWVFIVIDVATDSQPLAFRTFTWYVPAANAPEIAEAP